MNKSHEAPPSKQTVRGLRFRLVYSYAVRVESPDRRLTDQFASHFRVKSAPLCMGPWDYFSRSLSNCTLPVKSTHDDHPFHLSFGGSLADPEQCTGEKIVLTPPCKVIPTPSLQSMIMPWRSLRFLLKFTRIAPKERNLRPRRDRPLPPRNERIRLRKRDRIRPPKVDSHHPPRIPKHQRANAKRVNEVVVSLVVVK